MATKFYSKKLAVKCDGRNYQVNVFTSSRGVHVHIYSLRQREHGNYGARVEWVEHKFIDPEGRTFKKILAAEDTAAFVCKWTDVLARLAA